MLETETASASVVEFGCISWLIPVVPVPAQFTSFPSWTQPVPILTLNAKIHLQLHAASHKSYLCCKSFIFNIYDDTVGLPHYWKWLCLFANIFTAKSQQVKYCITAIKNAADFIYHKLSPVIELSYCANWHTTLVVIPVKLCHSRAL